MIIIVRCKLYTSHATFIFIPLHERIIRLCPFAVIRSRQILFLIVFDRFSAILLLSCKVIRSVFVLLAKFIAFQKLPPLLNLLCNLVLRHFSESVEDTVSLVEEFRPFPDIVRSDCSGFYSYHWFRPRKSFHLSLNSHMYLIVINRQVPCN